jgi:hypothetical protein
LAEGAVQERRRTVGSNLKEPRSQETKNQKKIQRHKGSKKEHKNSHFNGPPNFGGPLKFIA